MYVECVMCKKNKWKIKITKSHISLYTSERGMGCGGGFRTMMMTITWCWVRDKKYTICADISTNKFQTWEIHLICEYIYHWLKLYNTSLNRIQTHTSIPPQAGWYIFSWIQDEKASHKSQQYNKI